MTHAPEDGSRRRFFRSFAGDLAAATVQALGLVSSLRTEAAEGVERYLSDPVAGTVEAAAQTALRPVGAESDTLLPAFRSAGSAVLVVDQQALPERFAEVSMETAADAARIIGGLQVRDSPITGQLAALGLALTATRNSDATAEVLGALLDGSANALLRARPTDRYVRAAVARMMGRYAAVREAAPAPEIAAAGDATAIDDAAASGIVSTSQVAAALETAAALREEAAAIVDEAARDHARLAEHGLGELSRLRAGTPGPGATGQDATLHILTHGATGALATGRVGSALGMIHAVHRSRGDVHVWIDETRPGLEGALLTVWELACAGISHTLVPDAAAGHLIATGRVDAVVVGAYAVAANGDVMNVVGTYPLAVLAARHAVPFYVCASRSAMDPGAADGASLPLADGDPADVCSLRGVRIAPPATSAQDPRADITPAELITAIVTGDGVVRAPFRDALGTVGPQPD